MESDIDLINFKGGLKKNQIINEIKGVIKEKLLKHLDVSKLKDNLVDLSKDILRHITVLLSEKKFTLTDDEIQTITLEIIQSLISLTNPEMDLIKASVKFIVSNKLIKRVARSKKIKKIVGQVFKRIL